MLGYGPSEFQDNISIQQFILDTHILIILHFNELVFAYHYIAKRFLASRFQCNIDVIVNFVFLGNSNHST